MGVSDHFLECFVPFVTLLTQYYLFPSHCLDSYTSLTGLTTQVCSLRILDFNFFNIPQSSTFRNLRYHD